VAGTDRSGRSIAELLFLGQLAQLDLRPAELPLQDKPRPFPHLCGRGRQRFQALSVFPGHSVQLPPVTVIARCVAEIRTASSPAGASGHLSGTVVMGSHRAGFTPATAPPRSVTAGSPMSACESRNGRPWD
jgi:hypothetical protein